MRRFRRCNRKGEEVSFSLLIFIVAILQFSVWSIGVTETPIKDFLFRQSNSLKSGCLSTNSIFERQSIFDLEEAYLRQQEVQYNYNNYIQYHQSVLFDNNLNSDSISTTQQVILSQFRTGLIVSSEDEEAAAAY